MSHYAMHESPDLEPLPPCRFCGAQDGWHTPACPSLAESPALEADEPFPGEDPGPVPLVEPPKGWDEDDRPW